MSGELFLDDPEPRLRTTIPKAWADTPLGRYQAAERERSAAYEAAVAASKPSPDEQAEMDSNWRKAVREKTAANLLHHAAKRRALKLQRTPPWADMDAIKKIYIEARRLSTTTGIPHHVDHDVPLQGLLASGLHVHHNLQILTGSENSRKSNRFEVSP